MCRISTAVQRQQPSDVCSRTKLLHDTRSHCGCVQDEVSSENTNMKQADG